MKYKNYLLGTSILFSTFIFDAYSASSKNCAEYCSTKNCQASPKLADNCTIWCQGLSDPQHKDRLKNCYVYAPSAQSQLVAAPLSLPTTPIESAPSSVLTPSNLVDENEVTRQKAKKKAYKEKARALQTQLEAAMKEIAALRLNNRAEALPVSEELTKKINEFKIKYATGVIPSGNKGPAFILMQEIDREGDSQAAEILLDYLDAELMSSDPERQDSIVQIVSDVLPNVIKDVQELRQRKQIENTIKNVIDKGVAVEVEETTKVKNMFLTIPLTQINPGALLLLFASEKFNALPLTDANQLSSFYNAMTLNQRYALLKKLSTAVSSNKAKVINAPNKAAEKIFSDTYQSLNTEKTFVPPKRQQDLIERDKLNRKLLNATGDSSILEKIVSDPAIKTTPVEAQPTSPFIPSTLPLPTKEKTVPIAPPLPAKEKSIPAKENFSTMTPVVPANGAGDGPTIRSGKEMTDNIPVAVYLKKAKYSKAQVNVIIEYMTQNPGVSPKTAVNTLIVNNHPLFKGTSIQDNT